MLSAVMSPTSHSASRHLSISVSGSRSLSSASTWMTSSPMVAYAVPTSAFCSPSSPMMLPVSPSLLSLGSNNASGMTSLPSTPPVTPRQHQQQQMAQVVPPVMHPNLVSTLKSIIDETPPRKRSSSSSPSPSPPPSHTLPLPRSLTMDGTTPSGKKRKALDSSGSRAATVVPVDLIHNRRPFRCEWGSCGKTFKNWQTLKMHLKTHDGAEAAGLMEGKGGGGGPWHAGGRAGQNKKIPTKCPKCGNTFVGLYELRRHYGRKHMEGEKPFGCKKCSKKFFVEVDLRDHEKVCGESLQCRCGMKFAFKCNLVNHMKVKPECQAPRHNAHRTASSLSQDSGTTRCRRRSVSSSPASGLDRVQSQGSIGSALMDSCSGGKLSVVEEKSEPQSPMKRELSCRDPFESGASDISPRGRGSPPCTNLGLAFQRQLQQHQVEEQQQSMGGMGNLDLGYIGTAGNNPMSTMSLSGVFDEGSTHSSGRSCGMWSQIPVNQGYHVVQKGDGSILSATPFIFRLLSDPNASSAPYAQIVSHGGGMLAFQSHEGYQMVEEDMRSQ